MGSARQAAIGEADAMESAWKEREREERERLTAEATVPQHGPLPVILDEEHDDPERTPETYVPPAECSTPASGSSNKVLGQSSQAEAQSAKPQTLGRPTDRKPKASTLPVMITETE